MRVILTLRVIYFFRSFFTWGTAADTKCNTIGDHVVLNSKCPKHVGSFGYDTGFLFLMRKERQ